MSGSRIAIASDWFAPRQGGIEAQLLELAERLGARGNRVDVLTSTPGARDGEHFRVRPLGVATLPFQDVVLSPLLFRAVHRELERGYDIVHAHVSVVSPVGWVAALVARRLGLPTVVTFHSVLRLKAMLLRAVDAFADLGTTGVMWTAVSRLVASQASGALRGAEVSVLPNGIDLPYWLAGRERHSAGPRWPTLVATMRLQRKKRPRALLRAFAQAAARTTTSARLLLVGDGPERASIERDIDELGLREGVFRVELLGWLGRDELRATYANADGYVLASTRESFGIASLEARAAGLPVITMRSGSTEFLTHRVDALLCDDDAELAYWMATFLSSPDLRNRLASQAGSLDRYDWTSVLADHETAYARARTRAAAAAPTAETSA